MVSHKRKRQARSIDAEEATNLTERNGGTISRCGCLHASILALKWDRAALLQGGKTHQISKGRLGFMDRGPVERPAKTGCITYSRKSSPSSGTGGQSERLDALGREAKQKRRQIPCSRDRPHLNEFAWQRNCSRVIKSRPIDGSEWRDNPSY
jgi:hypothetical protein